MEQGAFRASLALSIQPVEPGTVTKVAKDPAVRGKEELDVRVTKCFPAALPMWKAILPSPLWFNSSMSCTTQGTASHHCQPWMVVLAGPLQVPWPW